ncbi:MAG: tRNA pseudouridine(38-40) synthase TruA [Candidatus Latescibacteria bacterium]|nr:tRNA pseudouridine(38-40) synthase TruA [Candidatus Latescibacterota bacterium]
MENRPVKITIEYDGSDYHGWQRQPEQRTVQGELERAFTLVRGTPISVVGQGRTDSGVHAEGQVAHAFLDSEDVDLEDLRNHLNGLLGPTCVVKELVLAPQGFHARYSAISRHYRYQITSVPSPLRRSTHWYVKWVLDIDLMETALELCLGEHDFGAFCSHSREYLHTRCKVSVFTLDEDGAIITFRIGADRFLHNMVRRLIGEMVMLGRGFHSIEHCMSLLDTPGPAQTGLTAPAHALFLERIVYPEAISDPNNS